MCTGLPLRLMRDSHPFLSITTGHGRMNAWMRLFGLMVMASTLAACGPSSDDSTLFTLLSSSTTGITFVNDVEDSVDRHVLNYEYIYNGGGVAAGDINNDGLPDLYFTANMGPNALYVNQGDFRFKETTDAAGVQDAQGWTTGVTMADVNGDGLLDIYVCKAGQIDAEPRRNKLFINNGDGTFDEQAAAYGLDATSYSVHATFFDYDRDGDLDLYLLNNPPIRDSRVSVQPTLQQRRKFSNDQLFRNDSDSTGTPTFTDVTASSGIKHDVLGYGLSATVSDVNRDGWPDIYIANDYEVEDRLYINQGDGTFSDAIHEWTDYMSRSSMGADIADYDNDGWTDIFVLDMLPEDNRRQKLLNLNQRPSVSKNYQYQRNMLHLNNGNGTTSEVGQLAGVSNTDWSWAALFGDFDLDGLKDLYVTNGVRYDHTNMDFQFADYLPTLTDEETSTEGLYKLVDEMPSTPIPNYAFRNRGDLTFEKTSTSWGIAQKGFSNGAAYADLDADGDLDLVVNNIDDPAWIYRNNAIQQTGHHFLRIALDGSSPNRFGIGATVTLTLPNGKTLHQEMMPARGFQSSVEPVLTFGLGPTDSTDVTVTWPNQTRQHLSGIQANQTITLDQADAAPVDATPEPPPNRPFEELAPEESGLTFTHQENAYEDYRDEPLLPHMLARLGPALARGDVNGDGRADLFVGGARHQASALFVQRPDGSFQAKSVPALEADKSFEDVAATFFDANGDGAQDLYVVSGGRSEVLAAAYQDRLYLNDGTGALEAAPEALPPIESSGGVVAPHDYDDDGDVDLFVGGRVHALEYPLSPRSYLLENTGGQFEDVTARASEALLEPGMIADAHWADLTGNGTSELLVAGEWMPLRVFQPDDQGEFDEITDQLGLSRTNGWWNRLAVADLDDDGDLDIVAGNRGLNAQVQARPEEPASLYVADFDQDRGIEPIMSHYIDGVEYPVPRRGLLMDQLSMFRARYQTYEAYAEATMDELLTKEQWEKATTFRAYTFETSVFEQQEDGTFVRHALPTEAQFSPTRGIGIHDVNADGHPDVLLAGNDFTVRLPWGPSSAGAGLLLINDGNLTFETERARESGFFAPDDVRDLLFVPTAGAPLVVVANNNAALTLFEALAPSQSVAAR